MSDVSSETNPAPAPSAAPDLVQIDAPISTGSESTDIKASVKALNEQREARGEAVEVSREPETRLRWQDDKPVKLRGIPREGGHDATKDVWRYNRGKKPDAQTLVAQGWTETDAIDAVTNPELWRTRFGMTDLEAKEFARTGVPPPTKVGLVGNGVQVPPLSDDVQIDPAQDGLNLRQATRLVGNFREQAETARAQLLAELNQAQAEQLAAQEQAAQPQRASQPAQPQLQPQQQRPDPVAQTHAMLEAERQAVTATRQLSFDQAALVTDIVRWQQWGMQSFPELAHTQGQGPQALDAALAKMQRENPTRYAQFKQADDTVRAKQAQLAQVSQNVAAYETQAAHVQRERMSALRQQYKAQNDAAWRQAVPTELPQFASESGLQQLRQQLPKTLKRVGVSEQHIQETYGDGLGIDLRSAPAQMIMAKAAAWDLAVERQKSIASNRAPVPPVQRPGVHRPPGAGAAEDVRALERQLANATGNESLRIATRLTQARRALTGGR